MQDTEGFCISFLREFLVETFKIYLSLLEKIFTYMWQLNRILTNSKDIIYNLLGRTKPLYKRTLDVFLF